MKLPYSLQQLYMLMLSDNLQITQRGDMIEIQDGLKQRHVFVIRHGKIDYTLLNDIVDQAYSALGKEIP